MEILLQALKAVGVLALVTGSLSLLLVIAERYLANFGPCKITINKEEELTVDGGGHLLGTLVDNGIFIPSACGGRGTCGYCKVKVLEGAGPVLPTEEPHLSPEEKEDNVRLSCCVRVRNDLAIEIPESILSLKEYETTVERIRDLTYDIKEIRLSLPEEEKVKFKAGQYMQLKIPPYGNSMEPVYRAYSISSASSDEGALEFLIRKVPSGIATTYVFEHLKEGDTMSVNGPYGEFFLRDTDAEIIFVAGSTGMAPINSILHQMIEEGIDRKATYYFGAVEKKDMFYLEEMKAMEEKLPNFTFVPALSKPVPEDKWTDETGLITEVMQRRVDNAGASEAYLCGSPGMIDACIKVLTEKGMPTDKIFYDKFA